MKLLLVEDNPNDARLLGATLKRTLPGEFELAHVGGLEAALERLCQDPFDLVFLDLGLPDSQGMESLTRIQLTFPALPIIVLTGLDDPTVALAAVRAGAQDYLIKGHIDADLLTRTIRHAVERKRAAEELRLLNAELERRVEERTAELRASEERLRLAQMAAKAGSWEWDLRTHASIWSEELWHVHGIQPHSRQPSFRTWLRTIHPADRNKTAHALQAAVAAGDELNIEWRVRVPDGTERWLMARGKPQHNAKGHVIRYVGIVLDFTERKAAEEAVRILNQNLEARVLERTAELKQTIAERETEIVRRHQLEREILEISEGEQSRIGQDLHDGIGQELAGIAMLSDVLARKLQTEANPLAPAAEKVAIYVRAAIDSARRLARGLYPIELHRYGLLPALKDLADQTTQRTGIRCEVIQCGDTPQLAQSAEIHIYRIVQECINNAVKHANPQHITIESLAGDAMHTFIVTDDGIGFDVSSVSTSGMGLHLMDYRARVIGARIIMDQTDLGGTRITCRIMGPNPCAF